MPDTIKVFGSNLPKPIVFSGAGLGLVGGIYYYRKNKSKQAQQAAIDQAGGSSTDPATGYPYGSPEDAAALSAQSNYQMPATGGYGFTGYAGGSGSGTFGSGAPGSFNSNAEWAQYVEQYEINNMGADAPTVGNAIGKYLTGQPLSTDQVGIVQSAIAIANYPPVSGPNGNPPSYVTSNTSTTTPPGNIPLPVTSPPPVITPNNATVPNCVGKTAGTAHNLIINAKLTPVADPGQKATQIVKSITPRAGSIVPIGTRVLITI